MKPPLVIATILLGLGTGWLDAAQPNVRPPVAPDINSEEQGQALARRLRDSLPEEPVHVTAILRTRQEDGSTRRIPVESTIVLGDSTWKQTYQTTATNELPAQRLVILHREGKPNQYEFTEEKPGEPAPSSRTPRLSQPLGGSEFWVADLGMDFLHWPFQKLIRGTMRKGRSCQVLESLNPASEGYARVVCWIDREHGQPILAEAYDDQDRLVKEFSIGSLEKVEGQWQVKDMKIDNVLTGTKTWLEFDYE